MTVMDNDLLNSATFDPHSGNLGRAFARIDDYRIFEAMIPHIAAFLNKLHKEFPDKYFKFAFEMPCLYEAAITKLNLSLPPNVQFYRTDNHVMFRIQGTNDYICYLVSGPNL